jgi:transposase
MATRFIDLVEAGSARRRQFSDDDKARIVSEAMAPGVTAIDVARRHGICSSLLYRWRRKLVAGQAALLPQPAATFVPVEIAAPATASCGASMPEGAVEMITAAGMRVRLAPPVDPRVLKALLDRLA